METNEEMDGDSVQPEPGTSNAAAHSPSTCSSSSKISESDVKKRMAMKEMVERFFYQLTKGCGNALCKNENCASSGALKLNPNEAAAQAVKLYYKEAKPCEFSSSKIRRTQQQSQPQPQPSSQQQQQTNKNLTGAERKTTATRPPSKNSRKSSAGWRRTADNESDEPTMADEVNNMIDVLELMEMCKECTLAQHYRPIIHLIGQVFSSHQMLVASFRKDPNAKVANLPEKAPSDLKSLKKEDLRMLEGDLDKDEDSCAAENALRLPSYTSVDLPKLRIVLNLLHGLCPVTSQNPADEFNCSPIISAIMNALFSLAISLHTIRTSTKKDDLEYFISVFVIAFETCFFGDAIVIDSTLASLLEVVTYLPVDAQARLCHIWAEHCSLANIVRSIQSFINNVVSHDDRENPCYNENVQVVSATKVLKIVYYANIIAGKMYSSPIVHDDDENAENDADKGAAMPSNSDEHGMMSFVNYKRPEATVAKDPLAKELNLNLLSCRKPLLPYETFYSKTLCESIEMENDYFNYHNIVSNRLIDKTIFSFMFYSFILDPASKSLALFYDSRIRMYSECRLSYMNVHRGMTSPNTYLNLKVRRDHIIKDALIELEMVAMDSPRDLKKQLVVEFIGEQGLDEGGLSKEFFQIIIEKILNPDYGLFILDEETRNVWFNAGSFENEAQFTLVGILVGLAIYNNIILAVNFPMVVYRKLLGVRGSFDDLEEWNPVLYKSLKMMVDYDEPDFEEVFVQNFRVGYKDVFGNVLSHDLKPCGNDKAVTLSNKQEFVDLYADFLLNTSIARQFKAFRRGFQMVTDESPIEMLCRPEEIELLVCGSRELNFKELEASTLYDGYTKLSPIIIDFWQIAHDLPIELKKKLLEFTTGSDRVPVGGLSRLKMVIIKNGSDSNRLPTSHTCFNALLLPEYDGKEKLNELLLKAISYSKGFGMI